jgi:hypothetical protein
MQVQICKVFPVGAVWLFGYAAKYGFLCVCVALPNVEWLARLVLSLPSVGARVDLKINP